MMLVPIHIGIYKKKDINMMTLFYAAALHCTSDNGEVGGSSLLRPTNFFQDNTYKLN